MMEVENKVEIGIKGLVQKDMYDSFSEIRKLNSTENYLLLFVDYSDFDIPLGTNFNKIRTLDGREFNCDFKLTGITQQYNKCMDEIPKGWKTIISIKSENKSLEEFLKIEEIEEWYSSPVQFYFIAESK